MKLLINKVAMLAAVVLAACSGHDDGKATIKGRIDGFDPAPYPAMAMYNGITDTLTVDSDGTFVFNPAITEPTDIFFAGLTQQAMIWVKVYPGDRISFRTRNVDPSEMKVVFKGDRADVNNYLNAFKLAAENNRWRQENVAEHTFIEHKQAVDAMVDGLQYILDKIDDPLEKSELQSDLDVTRDNFYFRYVWATAAIKDLPADHDPDFVAYAQTIELNDRDLLNDGQAVKRNAADARLRWEMRRSPEIYNKNNLYQNKLAAIENLITDPDISDKMAGETILNYFRSGGDHFLDETFEAYKRLNNDPEALAKNEAIFREMSELGPGMPAPDIALVDTEGKSLMLSDLRGRNLYIDIWATWCGPCVNEIPYVEQLYQKYKDNANLSFVSISVDEKENAWRDKIAEDNPGWPNYLAIDGFKGAIGTRYAIMAIPRFMMIDREGKIVSVNAPRPSSDEIEEFLAHYL